MADDTPFVRCNWDTECPNPAHDRMPICFVHAYWVHREIDDLLQPDEVPHDAKRPALVYYLMLGPTTVKIGTTTDLVQRVSALRSDIQYVMAVEPGGHDVEAQRHRQFAAERIGRREDFRVSPELDRHIRELRDETNSGDLIALHRRTQRTQSA